MRRIEPRRCAARIRHLHSIRRRSKRRVAKLSRRNFRAAKLTLDKRGRLIAPVDIKLTHAHGSELVRFIRMVERAVLVQGKAVVLSFRETERFSSEGTLLLYAELDRIVTHAKIPKPISIHDPWRRQPREVLKQLQIHEITGDRCDIVPLRDDVVHWRSAKGKDQNGVPSGQFLRQALNYLKSQSSTIELYEGAVWPGLNEAQNNTIDHAYLFARTNGISVTNDDANRWSMFYQKRDGVFSLSVCDLGCGYSSTIDKTMPEAFASWLKTLRKSECNDTQAIKIAMEYGRSRTGQSERGKGSRNALSVLESHPGARMLVYSNRGLVTYTKPRDGSELVVNETAFKFDIGGTIVQWVIPLESELE